ncbi:phosphoribosylamine--glycine ligase [Thermoactinomyces mirandus]|uniref:Phosphoribosylamine--glycine ligase n=1 Tax=Thermoactinomyces mirandus TaxID=2756294 RepID=A0A7W1XQ37_9BACL|nr:phosphoribosylamine--glycine ligase [Thermoactinomyces mirandus]MBA4601065.1 phosphoribosylamine--glycine ligase [Thermoactinomyces mirandus]
MKVLVVGSGGREHAIIWKLAQSPKVEKIYCAPGNGGIQELAECVEIAATDVDRLVHFARENQIDLTVVGPEVPLLLGIVDHFIDAGLPIFGPNRAAAKIEGSKRFAKELMKKYQIPTADFCAFTDPAAARKYIRQKGGPIVVKADGLAAGKGVVVAHTVEEAEKAVAEAMEDKVFGEAGNEVVIEEFLSGQEVTLMAFMDGKTVKPMVVSQDHKPVFDGDKGPNTGGMGTYSPVPQIPEKVIDKAVQTILVPMMKAFRQEGIEYKGVLYAGLMITQSGPKVIEFNARFGDPEAQVVVPRLETDLVDIMEAVIRGELSKQEISWSDQAAVCVILASGGYPGAYEKGFPIQGLTVKEHNSMVFHAGTSQKQGKWLTAGGRVLGVTALGEDIAEARRRAYQRIETITFEKAHYRKDIASKAMK